MRNAVRGGPRKIPPAPQGRNLAREGGPYWVGRYLGHYDLENKREKERNIHDT